MSLVQELFNDEKLTWRTMTPEQHREYNRVKYHQQKEKVNARRRELYRLKINKLKEQKLLDEQTN